MRVQHQTEETYHVDWSPDGKFLCLSRGPATAGDPTKKGTFMSACEIVGVYAPGWNLNAVSAEREGVIDLATAGDRDVLVLTTNGSSNKESAWFRAPTAGKKR